MFWEMLIDHLCYTDLQRNKKKPVLDIYCCLRCLIHGLALSILNAIGDSAVETQVDFLHFSWKRFVNTVEDFYGIRYVHGFFAWYSDGPTI
jgi:hypothetical protein